MRKPVPVPELHSQQAQEILKNYDFANRLSAVPSAVMGLFTVAMEIYKSVTESHSLPAWADIVAYSLIGIVLVAWVVSLSLSLVRSAQYNPPMTQMLNRYLDDVLTSNKELIDVHRNVQTLELYLDDKKTDKPTMWLTAEGADWKVEFDVSPLGKRPTLTRQGATHVEQVINKWYYDQAMAGKTPVNVVLKQMWWRKPTTNAIVVNGKLHKSVKGKVTLLKAETTKG